MDNQKNLKNSKNHFQMCADTLIQTIRNAEIKKKKCYTNECITKDNLTQFHIFQ